MEKNVLSTDLTGKVAVVTGAGGVLCSHMSLVLARAGAKVALLNRTYEKAKAVEERITSEGGCAKAYACNVLDKEQVEKVALQVKEDLGSCDILVNGAGGNGAGATTDKEYYEPGDLDGDTKSFFDLDEKGIDQIFQLNFTGTLLPTQAFAKQMLGREGCCILNISSMNAYRPLTKIPAYSGAKAAVTNFTQWLAVHFAQAGIRVNAIAPGFFATAQNRSLLFNEDGTPTARTGKILSATPMRRLGDSEKDLDGAMLFLVDSEAAAFITGVCLPIDGGFSAYSGV
ncbi:MAG: SDR family oxidoreductase [Oscillospiraceae bacterium]|nr:SDR family oxidoreductase [Oscillospiraceae bacterium]